MSYEVLDNAKFNELAIFHSDYYKKNGKYHKDIGKLLAEVQTVIDKASSKYRKHYSSPTEHKSENYAIFLKCVENFNNTKNDFIPYLYSRVERGNRFLSFKINSPKFFKYSSRFQRAHGNAFKRLMNSNPDISLDDLIVKYASDNDVKESAVRKFVEYISVYDVSTLLKNDYPDINSSLKDNQEKYLEKKEIVKSALDIISKMNPKEQEIAKTLWDDEVTCVDLSVKYGVSKQSVFQHRQNIVDKLSKIRHIR